MKTLLAIISGTLISFSLQGKTNFQPVANAVSEAPSDKNLSFEDAINKWSHEARDYLTTNWSEILKDISLGQEEVDYIANLTLNNASIDVMFNVSLSNANIPNTFYDIALEALKNTTSINAKAVVIDHFSGPSSLETTANAEGFDHSTPTNYRNACIGDTTTITNLNIYDYNSSLSCVEYYLKNNSSPYTSMDVADETDFFKKRFVWASSYYNSVEIEKQVLAGTYTIPRFPFSIDGVKSNELKIFNIPTTVNSHIGGNSDFVHTLKNYNARTLLGTMFPQVVNDLFYIEHENIFSLAKAMVNEKYSRNVYAIDLRTNMEVINILKNKVAVDDGVHSTAPYVGESISKMIVPLEVDSTLHIPESIHGNDKILTEIINKFISSNIFVTAQEDYYEKVTKYLTPNVNEFLTTNERELFEHLIFQNNIDYLVREDGFYDSELLKDFKLFDLIKSNISLLSSDPLWKQKVEQNFTARKVDTATINDYKRGRNKRPFIMDPEFELRTTNSKNNFDSVYEYAENKMSVVYNHVALKDVDVKKLPSYKILIPNFDWAHLLVSHIKGSVSQYDYYKGTPTGSGFDEENWRKILIQKNIEVVETEKELLQKLNSNNDDKIIGLLPKVSVEYMMHGLSYPQISQSALSYEYNLSISTPSMVFVTDPTIGWNNPDYYWSDAEINEASNLGLDMTNIDSIANKELIKNNLLNNDPTSKLYAPFFHNGIKKIIILTDYINSSRNYLNISPEWADVTITNDLSSWSRFIVIIFLLIIFSILIKPFLDSITSSIKNETISQKDALTGINNRVSLYTEAGDEVGRTPNHASVIFIDLDKFKEINDTFGHAVGDRVIQVVAMRLNKYYEQGFKAFRTGGDEFAIVAYDQPENILHKYAEQILKDVKRPIVFANNIINPLASVGVSTGSLNNSTVLDISKEADFSLYLTKRKNVIGWFGEEERQLFKSLNIVYNDEIHTIVKPNFQPIVNKEGKIISCEALFRTTNENINRNLGTFFKMSETNNVMDKIDIPMLEETFKVFSEKLGDLQRKGQIALSINVHPQTLITVSDYHELLKSTADKYNLNPKYISIEVIEFGMDNSELIKKLSSIKQLGFNVSIDDFTAGASSLTRIASLSGIIDYIKIDRSAVIANEFIAKTIINFTNDIITSIKGKGVIVEGVENAKMIQGLDSTLYQGYLFSRPIDVDSLVELVKSGKSLLRKKTNGKSK